MVGVSQSIQVLIHQKKLINDSCEFFVQSDQVPVLSCDGTTVHMYIAMPIVQPLPVGIIERLIEFI